MGPNSDTYFAFSWKGYITKFGAQHKFEKVKEKTILHWIVGWRQMPKVIQSEKEKVKALIKEALQTDGYRGRSDDLDSITVEFQKLKGE